MKFAKIAVQLCILAAMILLHCTLLFCADSHCVYPVTDSVLMQKIATYFPIELFSIVPLDLKTLQLFAQWVVLIEAVLITHVCIKIVSKIISFIFKSTFSILFLMVAYYFYC